MPERTEMEMKASREENQGFEKPKRLIQFAGMDCGHLPQGIVEEINLTLTWQLGGDASFLKATGYNDCVRTSHFWEKKMETNITNRQTSTDLFLELRARLLDYSNSKEMISRETVLADMLEFEKALIDPKVLWDVPNALSFLQHWIKELGEINRGEPLTQSQLSWYVEELENYLAESWESTE